MEPVQSLDVAAQYHNLGGLDACPDAELFFHIFDVKMRRCRGYPDDLADIGVRFSLDRPAHAFDFSCGQRAFLRGRAVSALDELAAAPQDVERGKVKRASFRRTIEFAAGGAHAQADSAGSGNLNRTISGFSALQRR